MHYRRCTIITAISENGETQLLRAQIHRELVYRPFQFRECGQHFIGPHNETLSVAMRVNNPDCSPSNQSAETQPKLQPDFLRLSATLSQYFMTVKWLGLEWPARDARNKLARNEAKRSKPMLE